MKYLKVSHYQTYLSIIASEAKGGSEDEFGLSDKEKEQLMSAVEEVAADVQKHTDEITKEEKNLFEN